jgi:hypothetical protein
MKIDIAPQWVREQKIVVMYHDDDCNELLDKTGMCPRCKFHPDMQSTGFVAVSAEIIRNELASGRTFLGEHRVPIEEKRKTPMLIRLTTTTNLTEIGTPNERKPS